MHWYIAKLVFRIICGDGDHTPQFDEQLRLIEALDASEAFKKAASLGTGEEDVFVNDRQKMVQWQFINVAELYKLSALIDGAEIYSRIQEVDNAGLHTEIIHKKAANIRAHIKEPFLELY